MENKKKPKPNNTTKPVNNRGGWILKHLIIFGKFVGHLIMGTGMFAALLFFGGILNKLVHWAAPIIGDSTFSDLMIDVERFILYADITFICWWAVYSVYKAIKEMHHD